MIADPVLGPLVGETVKRLSGREDFGIVLVIVSTEGASMINSLPNREMLREVLVDLLDKVDAGEADAHLVGAVPS